MPRPIATRSPAFSASIPIGILVFVVLCGASPASAATTIIVNWSIDADSGSNTDTCSYTQGGLFFPDADGRCTFRRALREAGARPDVDRPITIVFSGLATGGSAADQLDDGNYDSSLGVWTLPLSGSNNLPDLKRQSILDDACNVTISGPNTRSNRGTSAPSVFIQLKSPLTLGCEGNVVQYLGFFGGSSVRLMKPNNTFRYNTWGLTTNGMAISFQDSPPDSSLAGAQGVFVGLDGDNAVVTGNVISGASTRAIEVNSGTTGVEITENKIGTRIDGTVPARPGVECQAQFAYDPSDWYGGWGISLAGTGALIQFNLIAGLQNLRSTNDTPPMAIEVFGADHQILDNLIGVGNPAAAPGVCGQGIKFSGTNHEITTNIMRRVRKGFDNTDGALLWSDDTFTDDGGNTVRGNLSIDGPEKLYEMGPMIGSTIRAFQPGVITSVSGMTVTGSAAAGSPCANCIIDFYIDDMDANDEALGYAGSLTANASGNFSGTVLATPGIGQGFRTMTTSVLSNQIGSTFAGTTSEPSSTLYPGDPNITIFVDDFESGNTSAWQ